MCGAWSGSGGWSAASTVRWPATAQLLRTRASVRGPARGAAHGWRLHVWRVEAGRQVAAVDGDGNSTTGGHDQALSEHAPGDVGLSGQYCSTGPGPIRCTMLFFPII
jgi:hypothetical protein